MKLNYLIQVNACVIQNGITKIGKREAKQIKEEFSELILPKSLQSIGESTFEYKNLLKSVHLPEGLKEIGANAFAWCDELKEASIPGTVIGIGKEAFNCCKKLSTVIINNGVQSIGVAAFANCGITALEIPKSVKEIKKYAFDKCHKLSSLKLPCSITKIGAGAFTGTAIKDIYLYGAPKCYKKALVTAFNNGVFGHNYPGLAEVYETVSKEDSSKKNIMFYDIITLHVPEGTYGDYKNDPFFCKFKIVTY